MAGGGADDDDVVEVSCGGDPGAYAAVLKRKLDLYCAAVAKSMNTYAQPHQQLTSSDFQKDRTKLDS